MAGTKIYLDYVESGHCFRFTSASDFSLDAFSVHDKHTMPIANIIEGVCLTDSGNKVMLSLVSGDKIKFACDTEANVNTAAPGYEAVVQIFGTPVSGATVYDCNEMVHDLILDKLNWG